ncbi:hypothetical protein BL243_12245 [Ralstonia solanacearum]|nr:hypothetical protein BL243_12245 [Ralstonia solanacearum]
MPANSLHLSAATCVEKHHQIIVQRDAAYRIIYICPWQWLPKRRLKALLQYPEISNRLAQECIISAVAYQACECVLHYYIDSIQWVILADRESGSDNRQALMVTKQSINQFANTISALLQFCLLAGDF